MKRRNDGPGTLSARQRVYMATFGLVVLVPGLMALLRGGNSYIDHRGLIVFAPAMILVGVLMIAIAVVRGKPTRTK
jgi:hypothetical protein